MMANVTGEAVSGLERQMSMKLTLLVLCTVLKKPS